MALPQSHPRSATGVRLEGALGQWTVAAGLMAICVLSTAPTPLYVSYSRAFHFSQIALTELYAAYVVGSIAAMLFLGSLSDQVGRRRVLLAALAAGVVAAAGFLCATSIVWLFASRIASGIAVALASGAAMAWIVELDPSKDRPTPRAWPSARTCWGSASGPR